jgi:hypothetical protein
MSERNIAGGNFVPMTKEGDPGKLEYLSTPGWKGKTFVGGRKLNVDKRACPGCMFPDAPEGKWPHTNDERCMRWMASTLVSRVIEGSRPIDCPKRLVVEA